MSKLIRLRQDQALVQSIETAVAGLQEISVLHMQSIRNTVVQARSYQRGLLSVFSDVRQAHSHELEALLTKQSWWKKPISSMTNAVANEKKVVIFSSPDQRFAGSIAYAVFELFAHDIATTKHPPTIIILGQIGKELMTARFGNSIPFTYLPTINDTLDNTTLTTLVTTIQEYRHVVLFHGQLKSFAIQEPTMVTLTANESLKEVQPEAQTIPTHFLFEPDLPKLVHFFESEVVRILLLLRLHESRLAHLGSRITALEQSHQSIMVQKKKLRRQYLTAKKHRNQRKQLQRLAGSTLWS